MSDADVCQECGMPFLDCDCPFDDDRLCEHCGNEAVAGDRFCPMCRETGMYLSEWE